MNHVMILATALTVGASDGHAYAPIIINNEAPTQQANLAPGTERTSDESAAPLTNPNHRALTFQGDVSGDVRHITSLGRKSRADADILNPRIGIYRITGNGEQEFWGRVKASMEEFARKPRTFEKVVDIDSKGKYSLTVEDRGENAVAFILVAWDDRDDDRNYKGLVDGRLLEKPAPYQYLYWRTPRTTGFTMGFHYQKGDPQYADFLF